jgi:hypothetical protein
MVQLVRPSRQINNDLMGWPGQNNYSTGRADEPKIEHPSCNIDSPRSDRNSRHLISSLYLSTEVDEVLARGVFKNTPERSLTEIFGH